MCLSKHRLVLIALAVSDPRLAIRPKFYNYIEGEKLTKVNWMIQRWDILHYTLSVGKKNLLPGLCAF